MELIGVAFRYGRRRPRVLHDVALSLPPGRLVLVSGINGAGKSTLLRLVAGASLPTSGRIAGRPAEVGFAPERLAPVRLTAADFLTRLTRTRGAACARLVAPLIEAFELPPDVRLDEASKGTLQKANLVQALALGTELLVLDEPLNGLDAAARATFAVTVGARLAAGARVVVADHGSTLLDLLPGVETWHVADGQIRLERSAQASSELTELRVTLPRSKANATASLLRALGLDVAGDAPDGRQP